MRNHATSRLFGWFCLSALSCAASPARAQIPPGSVIVNVASAETPPATVVRSNAVVTPVAAPQPLRVTKGCSPSGTVPPGTVLTFTLLVENLSGVDLTGVLVADPLDPLLLDPSAFTTGSAPDAGPRGGDVLLTGSYDPLGRALQWDAPLVPAGARFALTFTVQIDPAAPDDALVRNVSRQTSVQDPAGTDSNEVVLAVVAPALAIEKRASRDRVDVGDPIGYTIQVSNVSTSLDLQAVEVRDLLPDGLRYLAGSARLDGSPIADPAGASSGGRALVFDVGGLARGGGRRVSYVAVPTPRADGREVANQAWGRGLTPAGSLVTAGPARCVVRVAGSLLSGEAVVVGRVYLDDNRNAVVDEGEAGVPAARVYLEDGTFTLTDVLGKYHLEGVRPGLHVVKVDQATLPEGIGPIATWSRSAGASGTLFTDVGPDQLFKSNVAMGGWGIAVARLRARAVYRDLRRGRGGERTSELREVIFPPLLASSVFESGSTAMRRSAPGVVQAYAALIRERGGRLASLEVEPACYPLAEEPMMRRRADRLRAEIGRLVLAGPGTEQPGAAPVASRAPGRGAPATADLAPASRPAPPPGSPAPAGVADASAGGPVEVHPADAGASSLAALESDVRTMTPEPAVLAPAEGDRVRGGRVVVDVKLPAGLTPRLRVNDQIVGNEQIAVRMSAGRTGVVFYRFLGVPFVEGRNAIVLEGIDQWGEARAWVERIVQRAGRPGRLLLDPDPASLRADGRTPAEVRLVVADAQGLPVEDGTVVTLESDGGDFIGRDGDERVEGFQAATRDGAVLVQLAPASRSADVVVRARAGEAASETRLSLQPELRDWIVAGVGEAGVGRRGTGASAGPPGGPSLEDLLDEEGGATGRMAVFARGRVLGASSLTLAYDSGRRRDRDEVFRRLAPDRFFPIYGDSSAQGWEVESQGKFSMKLQQPHSSLSVGDFTSGLAGGDLLRYDRALTGGAGSVALGGFTLQSFGATTPQTQARDELAGAGVSGPYRLSRRPAVINSERVVLETRDRFHGERVLASTPMARHGDYSVDYENGTIFFKRPVPFQDDAFNPVTIVVLYEVLDGAGRETVAGGRAGYRFGSTAELGATYVTEGRDGGAYLLRGADFKLKRAFGATVIDVAGEAAASRAGGEDPEGAVSLRFASQVGASVKLGAHYRSVAAGFGNPSRAGSADAGTLRWGLDGEARLPGSARLAGEVFMQEEDLRDQRRRVGALTFEKTVGRCTARSGIMDLRAPDPIAGETASSRLLSGGLSLRIGRRVEGSVQEQQVVSGAALPEYPTRTALGISWEVTDQVRSFLRQEFDRADGGDSARTVVGMESQVTRHTVMESRYSIEDALAGARGQAHLGVRTKLPLDQDWRGDVSAERVATTRGRSSGDFTSFGVGFEYLPARVKFTTRYELRLGDEMDQHVLTAGGATRLSDAVSLFSRERLLLVDPAGAGSRLDGDGVVGLAFRPVEDDRLNVLVKLQGVKGEGPGAVGSASQRARSYLGIVEANYQPVARLHLIAKLALKDSRDIIEGDSFSSRSRLTEARALVDIGTRFNAGASGRVLHQAATGSRVTGLGLEGGWRLLPDVWLVGGYNLTGFQESGFGDDDRRNAGPFVSVRFKFDEETLVGLSRTLSRPPAPTPHPAP